MTSGSVIVCTFTNTRDQGSIELKKHWVGTAGNVTIKIGTAAGGSEVDSALADGADATTGPNAVDTGTYYVSETDPGPYGTTLDCVDNSTDPATPVAVGADDSVARELGSVIVCTFTNTRDQGSIELKKHWVGHGGNVTIKIGTAAGGKRGRLGAGRRSGCRHGSERGRHRHVLRLRDRSGPVRTTRSTASTTAPTRPRPVAVGTDDSVDVTAGSVIVCTFTNTRNQGSIELKKHWVGTAGNVTIKIGTTAGG